MNILIILITIFCCAGAVIIGILKNKKSAPYFIFGMVWLTILVVFLMNSGKWNTISVYSSFVILFGILMFLLSSFLFSHKKIKRNDYFKPDEGYRRVLYIVLAILTIVSLSENAISNLQMLRNGLNFNDITIYYLINQQEQETGSAIWTAISVLLAKPMVYVALPILGLELFSNKRSKLVVTLSTIIIILNVLQGGKRSMMIYAIVAICVMYYCRDRHASLSIKLNLRYKMGILVIISIIIYGIFWVSSQRDTDIISSFSAYLSGCIPSMNYRIPLLSKHYYGAGLLHGILVPLFIGLNFLGIPYPSWWRTLDILVEAADYVPIAYNDSINAFNSLFYIPYIDGGIIGVILEMILIGIFYGIAYNKLSYNNNTRNRCIYALLVVGIAGSMYTLYFTQYPFALSFFYILLLTSTRRKNEYQ